MSGGSAELEITLEDDPTNEAREAVHAGLRAFNVRHAGEPDSSRIAVVARTPDGEIVGGVFAEVHWRWLYINAVWVAGRHRGKGAGKRMLKLVEAEAVRRGCEAAGLDTFEFQARGFYERHGYVVYGVLEGFPPGSRKYYLRKQLSDSRPEDRKS